MLAFLNRHKTKLLGFAITVLSAAQAGAAQLGVVLSPRAFALTTLALGIVVSALGFINTALQSRQQ